MREWIVGGMVDGHPVRFIVRAASKQAAIAEAKRRYSLHFVLVDIRERKA